MSTTPPAPPWSLSDKLQFVTEPMRRAFVLGGARSGKSSFAEALLADVPHVTYLAAWNPHDDPEWSERVQAHRARRPAGWLTIEDTDVAAVLRREDGPVLVDCVTTWLAAVMDDAGCWHDAPDARMQLADRTEELVAAYTASRHVIAVSNEVGQGVVPETVSGRAFRDEMGRLNQQLAAVSDQVWFLTAGVPVRLR